MKTGCLIPMFLALPALAGAGAAADVTACVAAGGPATVYPSKKIASSVFQKAGVTVDWRQAEPHGGAWPGRCVRIELAARTPEADYPGALAVSFPYAGGSRTITVFSDRIRDVANGAERELTLLAYVLVHEITHIIQGVDRHSDTGVMKARWNAEDRAAIFARRLDFADEDVFIIRQALAKRGRGPEGLTRRSE